MGEFILLVLMIWFIWFVIKVFTQENNSHSASIDYKNHGPLKGKELLKKVKELSDISKSNLVKACGYVRTKKGGGERLNYTDFYEALLEAKGIGLSLTSQSTEKIGKESKKLTFIATVNNNGDIEIDKEYIDLLDLKPGDQLDIKLGRKGIRLVPPGSNKTDYLWRWSEE